ncbi:MAG TPA: CehA/McbA family metallohydrolase, partial [Verrucomicrobiae bacterium]
PEYSMEKQEVVIEEKADGENEGALQFELRREVGTTNWVAADTHIHTLSLSKHGDALLQERMVTLAGEGIEMAIATEHNLHASYAEAAREVGVEKFFTVVPGNEVTTKRGHFNVFPVSTGAPPADFNVVDWPQLIPAIRRSGGARGGMEQPVVILNHPTDTHAGFTPFAKTNFNRLTGKNLAGKFENDFEAMEVINSGAMRTDWMEPFECWFTLLNRGLKVTGVAASDSHDVSRFIVGQGRTYIRGADTNAGALKVRELTENLREGRAVFGLGLFAQLSISDAPDALDRPSLTTGVVAAGASGPGDLHKGESRFFEVTASVDFPTWMNAEGPTVLTLYENGAAKVRFPFEMRKRAGRPLAFKARFPKLKGDAWYVVVAETPGVTNAYWSVARPYQPSGPEWHPQMIGATNPVYVDGDGNGFYTSPRKTAQVLCESYASPHDLIPALGDYGRGTALQVAEILHEAGIDLAANEFAPAFGRAAPFVKEAVRDYLGSVARGK